MALPALATVTDLANWLGQTIADDDARAQAVLAAASTLVRGRAHQNWVDAEGELETEIPDGIGQVVVMVAARIWGNPTAASDVTTGPYKAAWAHGFELTEAEAGMVDAAIGATSYGGIGVLQTTRGDLETSPVLACTDEGLPGTIENDTPYGLWP